MSYQVYQMHVLSRDQSTIQVHRSLEH